jgi:hypothetical protein
MVNQALAYRCERGATSPAEITGAVLRLTCIMGSMKQSIMDIDARALKRHEQIMLLIECAAIDLGEQKPVKHSPTSTAHAATP